MERNLAIVVVILVLVITMTFYPKAVAGKRSSLLFEVGGELFGNSPFLIGHLNYGRVGCEVGFSFESTRVMEPAWREAEAREFKVSFFSFLRLIRYNLSITNDVAPYIHAGVVGFRGKITKVIPQPRETITIRGMGSLFGIGTEFRQFYNSPFTIFIGIDWVSLGDITLGAGPIWLVIQTGWIQALFTNGMSSGLGYHLGMRFGF